MQIALSEVVFSQLNNRSIYFCLFWLLKKLIWKEGLNNKGGIVLEFENILFVIVVVIVVAVFVVFSVVVVMFQGPPPNLVARFDGGDPVASDVRITSRFQVQEEDWSISLTSGIQMLGWSLQVDLYEEGNDNPLCCLKGKWDLLGDRVVWELGSGTTGGTLIVPYEYKPDLPPGRYYLKVYSTNIIWVVEIYENIG